MVTKQELIEKREQIQEDLRATLDGMPEEAIDQVCQVVVNNFKPLIERA
jgi:hypothetical protein